MPPLILPKLISCDEAGFTGNDMLNPSQRHFSYASHDLSPAESEALLRAARAAHRTQMPELKATKLLQTARGRDLIAFILDRMEGRYMATLYDKRLSLACKLFEYIYEPVLQRNNVLFYRNNLHRFTAMYLYVQMLSSPLTTLFTEFEAFMRSLDPVQAPSLLGAAGPRGGDPLIDQIVRFARGYRDVIIEETKTLQRTGATAKWVLDLSVTAVFSHLASWGERHELIEVVCDSSKPLQAQAGIFDIMVNRPERVRSPFFHATRPMTWNMSSPVAFASSAEHSGLQLADLIAGAAAAVPDTVSRPELTPLSYRVARHLHEDCILPDMELVDLSNPAACVNWVILEGLASRADEGSDPLEGMELAYAAAWATVDEMQAHLLRERQDP